MVNDDNWVKDPSGARNGNLNLWRDMMFGLCPAPSVGTVVVPVVSGKINEIGYRCIRPDGYHTIWERVKYSGTLPPLIENVKQGGYVDGVLVTITNENRYLVTETMSGIPCTEEGVYLCDGVYIDPEDCWF